MRKKDDEIVMPATEGHDQDAPQFTDTTWKPDPKVKAELTPRKFGFSLGFTPLPKKPDNEPLQ